jgi:hypothetical protein
VRRVVIRSSLTELYAEFLALAGTNEKPCATRPAMDHFETKKPCRARVLCSSLAPLAVDTRPECVQPAPICVLDEVDAPLDDANVDRFCTLLCEIADTTGTRFLVVTHHRITMERVDRRLFDVTMAERGVSQLVSVDLAHAVRLRQTA